MLLLLVTQTQFETEMFPKPKSKSSPRNLYWARGDSRKIMTLQKSIDQAEFIGWEALRQSFQNELDQLNAQIAQKAKK